MEGVIKPALNGRQRYIIPKLGGKHDCDLIVNKHFQIEHVLVAISKLVITNMYTITDQINFF